MRIKRGVRKEIFQGTKGKNCYGSTFICLDRYHMIRERIMETKKQHC